MKKQFAMIFTMVVALVGCGNRDLRGTFKKSSDGKTYLAIVDDNGGQCGPLKVDGKIWPYKPDESGPIAAGKHTVECGTTIDIIVPDGAVYKFDYWGP